MQSYLEEIMGKLKMKVRKSFVSNSSSCSFCLPSNLISVDQYDKIIKKNITLDDFCKWNIYYDREYSRIDFYTSMDNFTLDEWISFFKSIGIPEIMVLEVKK